MTEKELLTKYVNEAKSKVDNKRRSVEFLKNHIDEHKRELAAIEAVAFSTSASFEKREFFKAKIKEKRRKSKRTIADLEGSQLNNPTRKQS